MCNDETMSLKDIRHWNFLVDDDHCLIYCYVPKAACTNLKKFMFVLKHGEPYSDPREIQGDIHLLGNLTHLALHSSSKIEAKLKHYTKFMFVRHPFVRIISAYVDKIRHRDSYFYTTFVRDILVSMLTTQIHQRQLKRETHRDWFHPLKISFSTWWIHEQRSKSHLIHTGDRCTACVIPAS
ncbi:carbohydrate sulfotransferase 11-like [Cynoglossus semilaevis]|uniref:carbohydrate sulfotransferase 11-like n=1 Tax=Cynoglossus semilaevis TaxID=244447 RepID=UPI000D6253C8|nr:carbohydrate sulfotransferase 11-like [Cynoglossus semilaevis]